MIVLWSPIGPSVTTVALWNKKETIKNHILSVALAMALWPGVVQSSLRFLVSYQFLHWIIPYTLQSIYDALSKQEQTQPLIHSYDRKWCSKYKSISS